jgi:hypothetical protein
MHEYDYGKNQYMVTIYYEGKKLTYRLMKQHRDRHFTYWFMWHKGGMQELKYDLANRKVYHMTIHGQTPFPESFLQAFEQDLHEMG